MIDSEFTFGFYDADSSSAWQKIRIDFLQISEK